MIKRNYLPQSTLSDFAAEHDLCLVINERPHGNLPRYYCSFDNVETKDGAVLKSESGNGHTEHEAIADYATRLSCEVLVVNAMSPNRFEIQAPRLCHHD